MFVRPEDREGGEYRAFGASLNEGKRVSGEFCRLDRLQRGRSARRNPGALLQGRNTDPETVARIRQKLAAIGASTLDGTCSTVNAFLADRPVVSLRTLLPADVPARVLGGAQQRCEITWPAGAQGELDKIARMTNLLAMNAAVEAGRAAEAGKGFTVVADEVRKLADQSSAAAAQINGVIAESRDQIDLLRGDGPKLDAPPRRRAA